MNRKYEQWDNKSLVRAYRLLFSSYGDFSIEQIKRLNLSTLKDAFRVKAKETHPDKSKALGIKTEILTEKFTEISEAYTNLSAYVEKNRGKLSRHYYKSEKKNCPAGGSGNQKSSSGNTGYGQGQYSDEAKNGKEVYIGNLKLLFGQYLYYSGHISFKTLLDAIIWQRRQRDQYGKLAMEWGILKNVDILHILKNRKPFEKFGESAVRLGLINPFQHTAILIKQRKKQRLIGEFFIKNGILTPIKLNDMLKRHESHNKNIKMNKERS